MNAVGTDRAATPARASPPVPGRDPALQRLLDEKACRESTARDDGSDPLYAWLGAQASTSTAPAR